MKPCVVICLIKPVGCLTRSGEVVQQLLLSLRQPITITFCQEVISVHGIGVTYSAIIVPRHRTLCPEQAASACRAYWHLLQVVGLSDIVGHQAFWLHGTAIAIYTYIINISKSSTTYQVVCQLIYSC